MCAKRPSHLLVANVGKGEWSERESTADDTGLKEVEAPGRVVVVVESVF